MLTYENITVPKTLPLSTSIQRKVPESNLAARTVQVWIGGEVVRRRRHVLNRCHSSQIFSDSQ